MVKHIAIAGATASGKTSLSLNIAEHLGLEIVSCDSVAVYKELNIGTSKPSLEEQKRVKHYMIDVCEPCDEYNVSRYEREASQYLDTTKLIVGGSGFYLNALINGIYEAPASKPETIKNLEDKLSKYGLDYLRKELETVDPDTLDKISKNDRYRILRALAVYYDTGKTMSYFRNLHNKKGPKRDIKVFVISVEKSILKDNIAKRTEKMLSTGLIDEVEYLQKKCGKYAKALQSVGYKEVIQYLDGHLDYESLKTLINRNTYQLAKRQLTWFKRMKVEYVSKEALYKELFKYIKE